MAQENTEVVQEAIVEENKTEQVPVEQETENAEVQEYATNKEQEKTAEKCRNFKRRFNRRKYKTGNTCNTKKKKWLLKIRQSKKTRIQR